MAYSSSIEWTDATWNPITGCTKISEGCKNCYAEKLSGRLQVMGSKKYSNGFQLTVHDDYFSEPTFWKKPRRIFVNSMSDTFHESLKIETIQKIFKTMNDCPQHTFLVLTKRSKRLIEMANQFNWTSNIWLGVTVENSDNEYRVDDLKRVNCLTKFISYEPLLGKVKCDNLDGINWVIVGGESGSKARGMNKEWVDIIYKNARIRNIAFFFKQWGGVNKKEAGRKYEGREFNEYP